MILSEQVAVAEDPKLYVDETGQRYFKNKKEFGKLKTGQTLFKVRYLPAHQVTAFLLN